MFVCFLVVGCSFIEDIVGEDDDDDGNKYVYEYGLIDGYQKLSIGNTFEKTKSVRDRLRRKSYKYHSPSNTSESLFRNHLQNTTDLTTDEIEFVIRDLNERGNAILYFYYKGNKSKIIWYYLEKL